MKRIDRRFVAVAVTLAAAALLTACAAGPAGRSRVRGTTGTADDRIIGATAPKSASSSPSPIGTHDAVATSMPAPPGLPGMPPLLSADNVYAAAGPGALSDAVRNDRALVYVPNGRSNDVTVIDQQTMSVIDTFPAGNEPQHVVPSYDLRTLYVIADVAPGSGAIEIDPTTGKPGRHLPIQDPYNMYFTPDGRSAIVVAEYFRRLDFYDPHSWVIQQSVMLPTCAGVDHMDFSADGRLLLVSCEFADRVLVLDVATRTVLRSISLPQRPDGMPQDVKLSPDGAVFYVADMMANGVYLIDGAGRGVLGFLPTGAGTHGLYVDRTATRLFITNRGEGSISVLDLASRRVTATWRIPGGGSPDMGNVSADGTVFWVSGRYDNVVYAISTTDGHLIKKIPVGAGPHGLCVWPLPGRYSLGHTGIMR